MINLNDIVFKTECGGVYGTAFLISESFAMTTFHGVKKYKQDKIILSDGRNEVCIASFSDQMNKSYKQLDVVLLKLDRRISFNTTIEFVDFNHLPPNTKWRSRGFPASKNLDGDNINENNNNIINQQLTELRDHKIDIELEHLGKLEQYAGFSGAPLVVDNKIVGLINSELKENGTSKEINALSIKHFKKLLESQGVSVKESTVENVNTKSDLSATEAYGNLYGTDKRNLIIKLEESCPSISTARVSKYCQKLVTGKKEMERHNAQDIRAIKFRAFEACQDELLNFVEKQQSKEMTPDEISELLENFAKKAVALIKDRSTDYHYPLKNKDFMTKVVLDLINDCFLSFDEEGLYEA
ncbi:MAG: hypothetical protein ACJA0H_000300 [Francisellaceae bacterium]|jgi:hypothetical protein